MPVVGVPREELLGLRLEDFAAEVLPEEERARRGPDTPWRRALSGEPGTIIGFHENEHRRKDGTTFPVEVGVGSIEYAGGHMILASARDATKRKRAEEALRESEERFRALFEQAADAVFVHDLDGHLFDVNRRACESLGYAREELLSLSVEDVEREMPPGGFAGLWERAVSGGPFTLDGVHRRKDGATFPVEVRVGLFEAGRRRLLLAVARDVTERKEAEEALRESEERFRLLFERSVDYLVVHDAAGNVVDASAETCRSLGYSREEMLSMRVEDYETNLLSPEERGERERRGGTLWQRIVANEPGAVTEVNTGEHRRKDGTTFPVEVRVGGVVYAGERMILASSRDVTERKAFVERLEHQAFHDPLTGLPNRALFQDRLEHALARAGRDDGAVAVLFLDLDDFKVVNDSLGHEAGDRLLVEVAGRVRGCLRPGDTAARLGGDEFAVLLEGVAGEGEALRVADRIGDALGTPVSLGAGESHEARANASVGVALGRPGQRAGDLLRNADVAMYGAKARGKARHELFDPAMNERAASRLEAENGLRRAIGRGEIVAHYQPKLSLASGEVVGMEALARWEEPERGLVLPAEFIGLAEETGLIVPLGELVLREACRRAATWRQERAERVAVWVNLSPRQFHGADVVGQVSSVLEETGLEARYLGLEITEGVVMDDAESTIETLGRLKGLGVRLAIDDFGKGFSSLNYVKRFPVDYLKIDRSFVSGICERPEDLAIAQAVVALGHSLGMEVVAEGVETAEQLDLLRGLGCDHAQGYYLARPMAAEESAAFLAERADLS